METSDARLVAGYLGFVRFNENILYATQKIGPAEQGFEQFDFRAFNIDLENSNTVLEIIEIGDEIDLRDFDSFFQTNIVLVSDN